MYVLQRFLQLPYSDKFLYKNCRYFIITRTLYENLIKLQECFIEYTLKAMGETVLSITFVLICEWRGIRRALFPHYLHSVLLSRRKDFLYHILKPFEFKTWLGLADNNEQSIERMKTVMRTVF